MSIKDLRLSKRTFPVRYPSTDSNPLSGDPIIENGVPVTIDLIGNDSRDYRVATTLLFEDAQLLLKEKAPTDIAERDERVRKVLDFDTSVVAPHIVGWAPDEFFCGPYSPEAATALMKDTDLAWLREQVIELAKTRANFFRPVDSRVNQGSNGQSPTEPQT